MSNVENRASQFQPIESKLKLIVTHGSFAFFRSSGDLFIFTRVFLGYLWYFHFFRLAVVISTQLDRSALQWINKKIIMTKSARRGSMVPQEPSNNLFKSDNLIATFPQWTRGI